LEAIEPDVARMKAVLDGGKDPVAAEPLYVLLSLLGHPDAHEQARILARQARTQKRTLTEVIRRDASLTPYLERMTADQRAVLEDPARYLGASAQQARAIADVWQRRLAALTPP
jgi:adenylosuccinate lyase